jgi:hypothetical protein
MWVWVCVELSQPELAIRLPQTCHSTRHTVHARDGIGERLGQRGQAAGGNVVWLMRCTCDRAVAVLLGWNQGKSSLMP